MVVLIILCYWWQYFTFCCSQRSIVQSAVRFCMTNVKVYDYYSPKPYWITSFSRLLSAKVIKSLFLEIWFVWKSSIFEHANMFNLSRANIGIACPFIINVYLPSLFHRWCWNHNRRRMFCSLNFRNVISLQELISIILSNYSDDTWSALRLHKPPGLNQEKLVQMRLPSGIWRFLSALWLMSCNHQHKL